MVSKAMSGVKRPVLPDRERTSHRAKKKEKDGGEKKKKEGGGLGKEKSVNCKELCSISELFPQT